MCRMVASGIQASSGVYKGANLDVASILRILPTLNLRNLEHFACGASPFHSGLALR